MPILETKRLILRDFIRSDWSAIHAIVGDPIATQYMHFATLTDEQVRSSFEWCLTTSQEPEPKNDNWCLVVKEPEAVIGWFGIGDFSRDGTLGERRFGFLLSRQYWNHGYMTEALLAILSHEFQVRGTARVSATCETANPASARVMEKAGMRRERTVYDADFLGNWAERHHYAIERIEYHDQKVVA